MLDRIKKQAGNIDSLNADTSYESVTKLVEYRDPMELKELSNNNVIPPLKDEEYEELKKSIQADGINVPLLITTDGIVLSGNHRRRAANELNLDRVPVIVKSDVPPEDYLTYAIEDNLFRRQLTEYDRIELILKIKDKYKKIGLERRLMNLKKGRKLPEGVDFNTIGETEKRLSKSYGIARDKIKKYTKVKKEDPELAMKVRENKTSLNKAYTQVKETKQENETVQSGIKKVYDEPEKLSYRITFFDEKSYKEFRKNASEYLKLKK